MHKNTHSNIVDALAFPKAHISQYINLDECCHGGYFDPSNNECNECYREGECHWLFKNDEVSALSSKSVEELIPALEYSISFMDLRASDQGHNYRNCSCDACEWLRSAYKIFNKVLRDY